LHTGLAKFDPQETFLVIGHRMRSGNTIDYATAFVNQFSLFAPLSVCAIAVR
jgi:hypothetical protein